MEEKDAKHLEELQKVQMEHDKVVKGLKDQMEKQSELFSSKVEQVKAEWQLKMEAVQKEQQKQMVDAEQAKSQAMQLEAEEHGKQLSQLQKRLGDEEKKFIEQLKLATEDFQ